MPTTSPPGARLRRLIAGLLPPLLVAVAVWAVYLIQPDNIHTSDAVLAPHVTASLIYDRDPFLDEFRPRIEEMGYRPVLEIDGRLHSYYPLGSPLLAVPGMLLLDAFWPPLRDTTVQEYLMARPANSPTVLSLQLFNAAWLVALSAAVIYLIGREYLRPPYALLLALTYALGTAAYSTASRALWQHGPSMLMLSVALLLLVWARRRPALAAVAALPLAMAFIVRPTNAVSIAVFTVYVLLCHRRQFVRYMLLAAAVAIPFLAANLALYGNVLAPYFSDNHLGTTTFGQALLGHMVSPARGVLTFSPILLLAVVGIWRRARRGEWRALDWAVAAALVGHWLVVSAWANWWGGFSFGPRMFADAMPFVVYFLIPVLAAAQTAARPSRLAWLAAYLLLLLPSIAIHYRGATSVAAWGWNTIPTSVEEHPERLWDFADPQFMRGLGPRLVAVAPTSLSAEMSAAAYPLTLYLGSTRDQPVDLTVWLPARVNLAASSAAQFDLSPLPGGGQSGRRRDSLAAPVGETIEFLVDTADVAEPQSLPAILLVAQGTNNDDAGLRETIVIPLTAGAAEPLPPADVALRCAPGRGELAAFFGPGWHDRETAGDAAWRWAISPAMLFVRADRAQTVAVELAVANLHAGTADGLGQSGVMRVTLPDGSETEMAARVGETLRVEEDVSEGWNVFVFDLEAGNFRPADLTPGHYDTRELSFAVAGVTVAGSCAAGD